MLCAVRCTRYAASLNRALALTRTHPHSHTHSRSHSHTRTLSLDRKECFDSYTIAFGIRNVTDIPAALAEARRVLAPGGRFLCLEFSRVQDPLLRQAYDSYSFAVIPAMGQAIASDRDSYQVCVTLTTDLERG